MVRGLFRGHQVGDLIQCHNAENEGSTVPTRRHRSSALGRKATVEIVCAREWPFSFAITWPLAAFHTRAVVSTLAVTTR